MTVFITVGNRNNVNDTIESCFISELGSTSQEAVDAFNDALVKVDRASCCDDYEFMCTVMRHARAKLDEAEAN